MLEDRYRDKAKCLVNKIEISRRLISFHKPSIGYVGEVLLRKFVESIIPKEYGVCTGFIRQKFPEFDFPICINGFNDKTPVSDPKPPQCDIIIYRKDQNALEFECGDLAIVNREFVHMVIEVKSSIGPKGFEKTLSDFELINTERKVLFIYTGPTIYTIKKYFDNIDIENTTLKEKYLDSVDINDCVIIDDDVVIDKAENVAIKYKYDHNNFGYLPELIVSITPNKEFFLSKGEVILDSDYMGYNSLIFEDSKHRQISCLQELACYIDMSFGQDNYIPDRSKINNFYAIPLFRM